MTENSLPRLESLTVDMQGIRTRTEANGDITTSVFGETEWAIRAVADGMWSTPDSPWHHLQDVERQALVFARFRKNQHGATEEVRVTLRGEPMALMFLWGAMHAIHVLPWVSMTEVQWERYMLASVDTED